MKLLHSISVVLVEMEVPVVARLLSVVALEVHKLDIRLSLMAYPVEMEYVVVKKVEILVVVV